jgi:hypothetical protein
VVAEMVRVISPAYPELDDAQRARVLTSVTAFVSSQIEAMPRFLAIPYGIAITAFQLLAILRFGRGFRSLDETSQRSYLAMWSDAKLGPFRDFVKLIRSCTLLAYFDHPEVTRQLPAMIARPSPVMVGDVAEVV